MKTYSSLKSDMLYGFNFHFLSLCKKQAVLNKLHLFALLAIITLALPARMQAQTAPAFSYMSPRVFAKGTAINSLIPINIGGAVSDPSTTIVTTLAGSGARGYSDGTGTSATFNGPNSACTDGTNLYVADEWNNEIRKIVISTGVVSTIAGSKTSGSSNGTGTSASFDAPSGICTDGTNLYVTDAGNCLIRKIVISTGVVTTLAGSGVVGSSDGTGTLASFHAPEGICTDGVNLYVADKFNNMIRKIVISTGVVTTLAGSVVNGYSDGAGASAKFWFPQGICTDGTGLYVTDNAYNLIRKIVISTGVVTTLAGDRTSGSSNGTGTLANFYTPEEICTDGQNIYVADQGNNLIRQIVISTGVVTTLAGSGVQASSNGTSMSASFNGPTGICKNGNNLYVTESGGNNIRRIALQGGGYTVKPSLPTGLSIDASTGVISGTPIEVTSMASYIVTAVNGTGSGNAAVTITVDDVPQAISYSTPQVYTIGSAISSLIPTNSNGDTTPSSGTVTTLAGSGVQGYYDGIGMLAKFNHFKQVCTDGVNLYVSDSWNNVIRKIVISTGAVTTLAGSGVESSSDGTGTLASFSNPAGICMDGSNLYVIESGGYSIRKINVLTGVVTTTKALSKFVGSGRICTDGTNVYVAAQWSNMIRKIEISTGIVTDLAGSTSGGSSDGTGTSARFNYVTGICTDGTNLYVVDQGNNKIRKIVISTGVVTTIAGSITSGRTDGVGTSSTFYYPEDICTDGTNLYVSDRGNNMIRKIVISTGVVNTLAGGGTIGSSNGIGTSASFNLPAGVSTDGINLYVLDENNVSVRQIVLQGSSYSVRPLLPVGLSIDATTGIITGIPKDVTTATDYVVTATNSYGSYSTKVNISVEAPTITYDSPQIFTKGASISPLTPTYTGDAAVSYSVNPSLPEGLSINATTGVISGTPIAYAPATDYTVTASNTGVSVTTTVNIRVNAAPSNLTYATPVVYGTGSSVNLSPSVTGAVDSYSVSPTLPTGLSLGTSSGVISGIATTASAAANYVVTATNSIGSTSSIVNITINAASVTTGVSPSNLSYPSAAQYVVGTAIAAVNPTYSGGAVSSFTVLPTLPAGLRISSITGSISGTPTAVSAATNYTITASNANGSTTAQITITVNAAGGTTGVAPLNLSYSTPAQYAVGGTITALHPSVSGGGVSSYSVSPALPSGLSLDASSGIISGTPTVETASTNYLITGSNATGSTTATVNITINASGGTTGVAPGNLIYVTPVTYSVGKPVILNPSISGTADSYSVNTVLPTGLSFDVASGVISGIPTAASAATNYLITATNTIGSTSTIVNITINAANVTTGVSPSNLSYPSAAQYVVGTTIAAVSPTVSGGAVSSFTVSPALPAGLLLNGTTGSINGTPTAVSAATNYTITASNDNGSTSAIINIAVNATGGTTGIAPSNLVYATPVVYGTGSSVNLSPSVTGAVDSYSVSPTLPTGLSLDATTGVISGIPTAVSAATNYVVTATNSIGSTSSIVNITINAANVTTGVSPSNLSYPNAAQYVVGSAIAAVNPSYSGGAVTSFTVLPTLPAGLRISSITGSISGTPTAVSAATNYTITASNANGSTTAQITISVNAAGGTTGVAPLNLSYSTPAQYAVGGTITALHPSVSGGGVSSYSVSPALPSGLSLDASSGIISGTPTVETASTNYLITGSNATGSTTATVNITINASGGTTGVAPGNLIYVTPVTYSVGKPVILNPSISGTADSYSVNTVLPTGLSFDVASGVISGIPTAASAATNYLITATNTIGSTSTIVNITINAANVTTGVSPSNLSYPSAAQYVVGTTIAAVSPTVSGGAVSSFTVSPALPAGLLLNGTTGSINGTPTAVSAATNYTITASNDNGSTSAIINIAVNATGGTTGIAPSNLVYATPVVYGTGSSVNLSPSVTGAVDSYSVSPTLPTGLSLDATTGVISGIPTAVSAATNYVVTATNSIGSTSSIVNITINAANVTTGVSPSNLSYPNAAQYVVGSAIAAVNPSYSGGAVTSFTVLPTLPAGLRISSITGSISGTPTAVSAATNYTITASNANGSTTAQITISVNAAGGTTGVAPLNLSYSTPAQYAVGAAITALRPSVSEVVSSYTVSPALPSGLSLDASSGIISGTPTVETASTNYLITGSNATGSTTATVNITINASGGTTGVAPGNLIYATPVTYSVGKSVILNPGISGTADSYSINTALPAGLSFDGTSGVISGIPTAASAATNYLITATNTIGSTSTIVNITINAANVTTGVSPSNLSYPSAAQYVVGTAISAVNPIYSGGVASSFTVSPALPAGLTLNSTSGVISGTPTAVSAATNYLITASNANGSTNAVINLTVNATGGIMVVAPINLSYATPVVYGTGSSVNLSPSVTGAVDSYSVSPALPIGLSLDATTGVISGVPTTASAAANYVVTATNSIGSTSTIVNITITVATVTTGVSPSNLSYPSAAQYVVGSAIAAVNPSYSGGAVTSFTVSPTLPVGLRISTITGSISGTPTAVSAATNYLITASNANGSTSAVINLTVNSTGGTTGVAPLNLSYSTPAQYAVGAAITALRPSVSEVVSSYTVSPALPSGLSLDASSGIISGTPTVETASTNYLITGSNATGSTTATVNITINASGGTTGVAPGNLIYATPVTYSVGKSVILNPGISGTADSYSINTALPAGLSFDGTSGVISGIPTAASAATNYLITATNTIGSTSTIVNITINAANVTTGVSPSNLSYPSAAQYVVGTAISAVNPIYSGGVASSFTVSPALPAGLTLNSTSGVISGTPTAVSAATNYTITASNDNGSTSTIINITVNAAGGIMVVAPINLSYATPAQYAVTSTITALRPSVSGGAVSSYTVSPALPSGLSLDASSGIISGTPTAETASTNYLITATNSIGSTSAVINITVNAAGGIIGVAPGNLKYTSPLVYRVGVPVSLTPIVLGQVDSYSVNMPLPLGLSVDGAKGIISGTASVVSSMTNYLITATNSFGSTSFVVCITGIDKNAIAGDLDGDGLIDNGEIAGDLNGDGKITPPEIAGDTNGDGLIDNGEIAGDLNGDGKITSPELAGDKDGDGIIDHGEIAGDLNGDGTITSPEIAGDANGDGLIDNGEIVGDLNGDGKITSPEIAGDKDGGGIIDNGEIAGDLDGDGKITSPEIAGDKDGDGKIDNGEIAGDLNGDGKIISPELAGDKDGDGKIDNGEIAGDLNGDGKIVLPELAGDKDGDGIIDHGELAGDLNGDGKIISPELAGDKDGDGIIDHGEIAGDLNGDGKIVLPELAGDKDGDGIIDHGEIAGDLNGDGKIVLPELTGDKDGDGIIDHGEIVGDLNGDGKIVLPELAGDKDGDEIINHGEIAGDLNGDGKIVLPELAGDKDGDGIIDHGETAGDLNGDGKIVLPELAGDKDGDGIIDHGEIVGDLNGDGKIVSPELAGDKDGDGIIDHGETAGDLNGDGVISSPEILGDLNGDSKIDNSEIAGDANGDGKIGSGEVDATPILVSTLTPTGSPVIGCENSSLDLPYSLMTGAPTQYKLTFDALTLAAGVQNVPYTDLPASGSALALTIPDGIADGTYHGTLQLRNSVQESVAYPFEFNINVSSRYIVKKFDDVILIDNSSNRFTGYQWYKDGFAVQGATKQFYFDPNGLSGSYSVELTTIDGHKVSSCTKSFTGSKQVRVTAYPNPVNVQQDLTVRVSGLESSSLDKSSLTISNISGVVVYQSSKVEPSNSVTLPAVPGVYIGHIRTVSGNDYQFKVIVTQ